MDSSGTSAALAPAALRFSRHQPAIFLCNDIVPKKYAPCITNIDDIVAKPTPLYLPSSLPLGDPKFISLAPLLAELAHLAMLFILQLKHTANSVRQL